MDSKKVVIVVLVLIVVVFVVFVARGSLTADQPKSSNSASAKKEAKNIEPPNWSKTIKRIFGGLQETVVLKCDAQSPPGATRRCEKLPPGNIEIEAAKKPWLPFLKKTAFRTIELVLLEGQASVFYVDRKGANKIDNPQKFDLPNPENENSNVESLVVLEEGGTLMISCKANTACRVGQN